jgi:stearoyl-CoA desaturase (delta-9 desaturase)
LREILVFLLVAVVVVATKVFQPRLPGAVISVLFAIGVLGPFIALFYAMWTLWDEWIGWRELALFLGLYVLTGFGITLGFHRFLTHRSFESGRSLTVVLLALGSMANQGRCIDWAAHHLKHHAYSDREGDPHSPLEGLAHAYCGWILRGAPADRRRYCKRLLEDRLVVKMDRTAPVWVVIGLIVPYLVAGWPGLLWGGFARIGFTNHVAFAVNSFGHTYGSQPFQTGDRSRNNWFLAALSFGDGWHNNHHAFPAMASHGMSRGQFDPTGLAIRGLARLGLVWNVKDRPDAHAVQRRLRLPGPRASDERVLT